MTRESGEDLPVVFRIDGRKIKSANDFYREIGSSVNGPGGYFLPEQVLHPVAVSFSDDANRLGVELAHEGSVLNVENVVVFAHASHPTERGRSSGRQ
jgi:hypothetical protein